MNRCAEAEHVAAPDDVGRDSGLGPAWRGRTAAWGAGVMLVLLCCARYYGFPYPHYAGAVLFQFAVLGMGLLWAWPAMAREGSLSDRRKGSHWLSGPLLLRVYVLFSVCSALYARNTRLSAVGSLPIVFGAGWALGLGRLLLRRAHVRIVLQCLVVAGLIAAVAGIGYVLAEAPPGQLLYLQATLKVFGHRNFLAIFLLPPMLLCLTEVASSLLYHAPGRGPVGLPWPVALGCAMVMLAALALCGSIGAVLGVLAGAACLVAVRLSWKQRLILLAAALALGVAGAVVLSWPEVEAWAAQRQQLQRWFLWKGAVRMWSRHPGLGWGAGMFFPYFADFKPTEPMRYGLLTSITFHPHNEWLLVVVEGGVVGLMLYLGGLIPIAVAHGRAADREADPAGRLAGWAVLAAFVAMTVHGLVTVSLRYWAPGALYWTLAGLLIAYPRTAGAEAPSSRPPRSRPPRSRPHQIAGFVAAAVAAVAVGWWIVWSGATAQWLISGAIRGKRLSRERVLRRLTQAPSRSRYLPDYFLGLRRRAVFLQANGEIEEAIAVFERIEREAPGYGPTRKVLGRLRWRRAMEIRKLDIVLGNAELKRAIDVLQLAVKQNPYDVSARLFTARAVMTASARNLPVAIEHARAAVDAQKDHREVEVRQGPDAPILLAELLAAAGRRAEAVARLDEAQALWRERYDRRLKGFQESRARLRARQDEKGLARLDDKEAEFRKQQNEILGRINQLRAGARRKARKRP